MTNQLVAEALDILHEAGLAAEVHDNAPHYKVRFTNAFGRKCTLIISRSPSNRNAVQENRAVLRRLLRASA
jgi:hypothetical protein